ncbi:MAG: hypothetical protein ACLTLQ_01870 [[Clostridium] scindens]
MEADEWKTKSIWEKNWIAARQKVFWLRPAKCELYLKMRFMDVALSSLIFVLDEGACGMGTDGLYLYYHPQYLGGLYRGGPGHGDPLNSLDLVLHGIFRHKDPAKGQGGGERWQPGPAMIVNRARSIDGMQHRRRRKSQILAAEERLHRRLRKEMTGADGGKSLCAWRDGYLQ